MEELFTAAAAAAFDLLSFTELTLLFIIRYLGPNCNPDDNDVQDCIREPMNTCIYNLQSGKVQKREREREGSAVSEKINSQDKRRDLG